MTVYWKVIIKLFTNRFATLVFLLDFLSTDWRRQPHCGMLSRVSPIKALLLPTLCDLNTSANQLLRFFVKTWNHVWPLEHRPVANYHKPLHTSTIPILTLHKSKHLDIYIYITTIQHCCQIKCTHLDHHHHHQHHLLFYTHPRPPIHRTNCYYQQLLPNHILLCIEY